MSTREILEAYPDLEEEDISQALYYDETSARYRHLPLGPEC
jgi:uncharacterized protein (DUF433 family)